jgi:hypothetical protein
VVESLICHNKKIKNYNRNDQVKVIDDFLDWNMKRIMAVQGSHFSDEFWEYFRKKL